MQIRIDQRGYPQKVLEKFEMHTCKERAMPLESKPAPPDKDEEAMDQICTVKQWDASYMQLLEAALTSHTLLVFLAALLEIPRYTTGKRSNTYCATSKEPYILVSHLSTRLFLLLDWLHTQILTMVVIRWQASLPVAISFMLMVS